MPNLRKSIILLGTAILLSAAELDLAANYIPFGWDLATIVTNPVTTASDRFTQVVSPFHQSSSASLGPHSAHADYDFLFQPELNVGTFDTDVALNVSAASSVECNNTGRFRITPDADLNINIDGRIDYASPSTPVVDISFRIFIFDIANPLPPLFIEGGVGGTLSLNPPVGTLTATGNRVLLAGHTYQIGWDAKIRTLLQPIPGGPTSASGFVHLSLVPEPAALAPLAIAALLARRRRSA